MPEGEATQGEKRKMDACMHLNVFDNLYAAIRSQLYTLDKEEEKTMQHKEYQEIFTQMLDDIINDPGLKQNDIKRQLRDFADAIKHAENFRMMQAKMYHLPKITFSNRYQDRLHMDAIRNRITSTLKDIGLITDYISQQTESMRELLSQQELALKGFHAKTLANATYDSLKGAPFAFAFEDYENQINNIMESFRLKTLVAPFDQFDKQIKSVFGTSSDFNFLSGKKMRIKMFQAEVLCRLQRLVWLSYVIEHDVKM